MATKPGDSDDSLRVTELDEKFDRYQHIMTIDDETLIYDTELEEGWIQAQMAMTLVDWR